VCFGLPPRAGRGLPSELDESESRPIPSKFGQIAHTTLSHEKEDLSDLSTQCPIPDDSGQNLHTKRICPIYIVREFTN
jgi:hypothetical protein